MCGAHLAPTYSPGELVKTKGSAGRSSGSGTRDLSGFWAGPAGQLWPPRLCGPLPPHQWTQPTSQGRGHPAMWCGDCLAPGGRGPRLWQGSGAWGRRLPAKAPQPASRCCWPCGWVPCSPGPCQALLGPGLVLARGRWRGEDAPEQPTPSPGQGSVSPLRSSLGLWAGGVRAHKGPPRAQGTARRGDSPSQKGPACLPQGSGSPGLPRPECCAASETLTLHPLEVLLGPGQGTPEVSAEWTHWG